MVTQKAMWKGVCWEAIGVLSLCVITQDLGFSLGWVIYRTLTFPVYERIFKHVYRLTHKEKSDVHTAV
jgi:hypothetical protein